MKIEFPVDMREFHPYRGETLRGCLWLVRNNLLIMGILLVVIRTLDLWQTYGLAQMRAFPWFMLENYAPYALLWLAYAAVLFLAYWRRITRDKIFDVPHRHGFDEEALYLDIPPLMRAQISWERFNAWQENKGIVYLFTGNVVILLHKKIWSEAELETIRSHLRRETTPRKVWLKRRKSDPVND